METVNEVCDIKKESEPVISENLEILKNTSNDCLLVSDESNASQEWEVSSVVGRRVRNGMVLFKVLWFDGSNTWEPRENLTGCDDAINEFLNRNGIPIPKDVKMDIDVVPVIPNDTKLNESNDHSVAIEVKSHAGDCGTGSETERDHPRLFRKRLRRSSCNAPVRNTSSNSQYRNAHKMTLRKKSKEKFRFPKSTDSESEKSTVSLSSKNTASEGEKSDSDLNYENSKRLFTHKIPLKRGRLVYKSSLEKSTNLKRSKIKKCPNSPVICYVCAKAGFCQRRMTQNYTFCDLKKTLDESSNIKSPSVLDPPSPNTKSNTCASVSSAASPSGKTSSFASKENTAEISDTFLKNKSSLLQCSKCSCRLHLSCHVGKIGKSQWKKTLSQKTPFCCYLCSSNYSCVCCGDFIETNGFRCKLCLNLYHWKCIFLAVKKLCTDDEELVMNYGLCKESLDKQIHDFNTGQLVCNTCIITSTPIDKILTCRNASGPCDFDSATDLLIKFLETSYRETMWVSKNWLINRYPAKGRAFQGKCTKNWVPLSESDAVNPTWKIIDKILSLRKSKLNVTEVLVKWQGLSILESTWEEIIDENNMEPDISKALAEYHNRNLVSSIQNAKDNQFVFKDIRPNPKTFEALQEQPACINAGTLRSYQLDGLSWLLGNWCARTACILADEMGLGKTIQIIAFFKILYASYHRFPFLLVVPTSTIENWRRELKKWASELQVAVLSGSHNERNAVLKHEVLHSNSTVNTKCHVVLTSYEQVKLAVALKNITWEVLVVDEGHKLKNDVSKIFQHLTKFKINQKLLATGTPLQNNLRELFNLLFFIDSSGFSNPEALAEYYQLDADTADSKIRLNELHEKIRPHILRRTKEDVLKDLPPKSDIIVPVWCSKLQRELLKDVYSKNYILLKALGANAKRKDVSRRAIGRVVSLTRSIFSHPYLYQSVERGLPVLESDSEALERMINSCGKLELLDMMLPKLIQNGHSVLIFAQFRGTLDILQSYFDGKKLKFCRIDGATKQEDRQEIIDEFFADPDIHIFILTTRAGGVGINLTKADTIIIYDIDWNPHADIQAISRAHRIGQTKPVLSFKFITANSMETKVLNAGRKKLALDHVVVENMQKTGGYNQTMIEAIQQGARMLLDDAQIVPKFTNDEVDSLLDRAQAVPVNSECTNDGGLMQTFGFEKVWQYRNEILEDNDDNEWVRVLDQIKSRNDKPGETTMCSRRSRKTVVYSISDDGDDSRSDSPASVDVDAILKAEESNYSSDAEKAYDNKVEENLNEFMTTTLHHSFQIDQKNKSLLPTAENEINSQKIDLQTCSRLDHGSKKHDEKITYESKSLAPSLKPATSKSNLSTHFVSTATVSTATASTSVPLNLWQPQRPFLEAAALKSKETQIVNNSPEDARQFQKKHRIGPPLSKNKAHVTNAKNCLMSPLYNPNVKPQIVMNSARSIQKMTNAQSTLNTAQLTAMQSNCWICFGSRYALQSYHLPTHCPAICDIVYVQSMIQGFSRYNYESNKNKIRFLEHVMKVRSQTEMAAKCFVCQQATHMTGDSVCPERNNLASLTRAEIVIRGMRPAKPATYLALKSIEEMKNKILKKE